MIRKRLIPRVGQANDQPQQPGEGGNNIALNNIQPGESANLNLQGENLPQNPIVDHSQGQTMIHAQQPHHYGEEKSAEAKKKTRCRKWPMCKIENCEFAHPKETVQKFINL